LLSLTLTFGTPVSWGPRCYYLNKLCRGPLGDATYPIWKSRLCSFRKEDCLNIFLWKTDKPRGVANFGLGSLF